MSKNKKGIVDIVIIAVLILVIGIGLFFVAQIIKEAKPILQGELGDRGDSYIDTAERVINGFDYLFAFVVFGFMLFLVISSLFIDSHPAFFIIGVLLALIMLLISPALANVFESISEDPELASVNSNFPVTIWIFDHYPLVLFITVIIGGIVFYGKNAGG